MSGYAPRHDVVFIKRDRPETYMTTGGIVVEASIQRPPDRGEVVAVGPGRVRDGVGLVAPSVKVGDSVLFSGDDFREIDPVREPGLGFVHDGQILATIEVTQNG